MSRAVRPAEGGGANDERPSIRMIVYGRCHLGRGTIVNGGSMVDIVYHVTIVSVNPVSGVWANSA